MKLQDFYDREYRQGTYPSSAPPEKDAFRIALQSFIDGYELRTKRCLEVGCGAGAFEDFVPDFTGVDLSINAGRRVSKPFSQASAAALPFQSSSFDALWSSAVLEHVEHPEISLSEMRRVLKPGGLLLLAPAWQCRPWAADGYPVRPYSDLSLKGRLIKASIPLRDSVLFRSVSIFPKRFLSAFRSLLSRESQPLRLRTLKPNYERFWMTDSDAVNSIDPFQAILWFVSRGDECLSYPSRWSQFLVRTGAIVFRIRKSR